MSAPASRRTLTWRPGCGSVQAPLLPGLFVVREEVNRQLSQCAKDCSLCPLPLYGLWGVLGSHQMTARPHSRYHSTSPPQLPQLTSYSLLELEAVNHPCLLRHRAHRSNSDKIRNGLSLLKIFTYSIPSYNGCWSFTDSQFGDQSLMIRLEGLLSLKDEKFHFKDKCGTTLEKQGMSWDRHKASLLR